VCLLQVCCSRKSFDNNAAAASGGWLGTKTLYLKCTLFHPWLHKSVAKELPHWWIVTLNLALSLHKPKEEEEEEEEEEVMVMVISDHALPVPGPHPWKKLLLVLMLLLQGAPHHPKNCSEVASSCHELLLQFRYSPSCWIGSASKERRRPWDHEDPYQQLLLLDDLT
jgi:hypothetical protein